MEENLLVILSLLWLIYTFFLTDADRKLEEMLNRLKFSLVIDDEGINEQQLRLYQSLSKLEISQMGEEENFNKKGKSLIKRFFKNNWEIESGKIFLIFNLFVLTFEICIFYFSESLLIKNLFQKHIIISLLISVFFYIKIEKLAKVKFTRMVLEIEPTKKETPTA